MELIGVGTLQQRRQILLTLFRTVKSFFRGAWLEQIGETPRAPFRRLQGTIEPLSQNPQACDILTERQRWGMWMRQRRLELGLTQEDLARTAGVARTHICELERGRHRPKVSTNIRLSKALGVYPTAQPDAPALTPTNSARELFRAWRDQRDLTH
ncbi:MAG TPA: helix-turn-helix transcriptional regulator [Bdellovibrionota bacterium]|nr:helix-turn-helix transcriptional regulator [Bdellovibrionota bacterium]